LQTTSARAVATITVKLIEIDGSLAIVLPKEVVARLDVAAGGDIHLSEMPDGFELLSDFTRQGRPQDHGRTQGGLEQARKESSARSGRVRK
jgi:hypothetical protein